MKLFKVIASKAGRVIFDDRLEAPSPREAREQMKALTGLQSLAGVVYAVTEIPVELIQSIVDARLTEAIQRLQNGQAPQGLDALIRPIAGEEVRGQLADLRDQIAAISVSRPQQGAASRRFDAFTAAVETPADGSTPESEPPQPAPVATRTRRSRQPRPAETTDGRRIDWRAVRRLYRQNRSYKQTAAHFELSVNTVKARCRREGWAA